MIISTDTHTYLVKFSFEQTRAQFICPDEEGIMQALKKQSEPRGIEYIKQFDPVKQKFVKVSKTEILSRSSWQTETSEYLKSHYYFKK